MTTATSPCVSGSPPSGICRPCPAIPALIGVLAVASLVGRDCPAAPPANGPAPNGPAAAGVEYFERHIRPVLVRHCAACHSGEAQRRGDLKGGLRVDLREGLLRGGDSGPAVVPGKPEESLLLDALRHDGLAMPPKQKLPDEIVAAFAKWIAMGAPDPRDGTPTAAVDLAAARRHWAFRPVGVVPPPAVRDSAWPRGDVDRHLLARMEAAGLSPAPDAPPGTWLRRVSFDLTGLPPTPEELADFLADTSPDAAARVVDRLLASPRFGEHWARYWLDGVRFDPGIETATLYRDWVIRALNADLPYDRFLTWQLAGDLTDPDDPATRADRIVATQFLALQHQEMDPVEGMIEVVGLQMLGLSLACAKCHDHKFDAFTQEDYYGLAGVFTSSRVFGDKNPRTSGIELPDGSRVLGVGEGKTVGDTHLLIRGEKSRRGPLVPRRFPAVLAGDNQTPLGRLTDRSGRRELAAWVASPTHPLTARVAVNRAWQNLFGAGLVATANDFGAAGDAPTHPELLDALADRFVRDGWSIKRLVRTLVLSRAYRQSSSADPAKRAADPENRLLARMPVRRLRYEQILDALNAAAGVLSFDQPPAGKKSNPIRFAPARQQAAAYRAIHHSDPVLRTLFDGADPDLIVDRRGESVTAPQMLFFLNNPQVIALAGHLARRAEASAAGGDRVAAAYRICFARTPTDAERKRAAEFLTRQGFDRYCQMLLAASEFLYLE